MDVGPSLTLARLIEKEAAEVLSYLGDGTALLVPYAGETPTHVNATPAAGTPLAQRMADPTATRSHPMLTSLSDGRALAVPLRKSVRNAFGMIVTIGRSPRNDVRLLAPSVSKLHAIVRRAPSGKWLIRDAGSRNGTEVGAVTLAANDEAELAAGCSVRFGALTCLFVDAPALVALCRWLDRGP